MVGYSGGRRGWFNGGVVVLAQKQGNKAMGLICGIFLVNKILIFACGSMELSTGIYRNSWETMLLLLISLSCEKYEFGVKIH